MKTKVVKESKKSIFPALFIAHTDNTILLATSREGSELEGTILSTEGDQNHIGEFSRDWDVLSFEPFYGSVTLES